MSTIHVPLPIWLACTPALIQPNRKSTILRALGSSARSDQWISWPEVRALRRGRRRDRYAARTGPSDERQHRVKAAAEECDPRQHASNHDVRPELHHPRSAEAPAERQRDDEHGAERDRPHCFGRIKQRQRDEPERILREQEQEQEGNRRVFPPSWPVIKDRFGNPVKPRGWLLVPLSVGDEVVSRIKDGTITRYVYDPTVAHFRCRGGYFNSPTSRRVAVSSINCCPLANHRAKPHSPT